MREDLDATAARQLEDAIREIMRKFGISALYLVDTEARGGIRYWSFGDGLALLMTPAKRPQTYAVVNVLDRVAQAA